MKLPVIPLPEPTFTITLTRGDARRRRIEMGALRFLLWLAPAGIVDYVLATTDRGGHQLWLTLAATYATLAMAVLTVGVRVEDGEDAS